jgi:hypothetical protein
MCSPGPRLCAPERLGHTAANVRSFVALFVAFLLVLGSATQLYPGGTWFDRDSPGFSFWGNFWCDLLHERAFNGADNALAMWAARVAFWLFAAALVRFWPQAAALAPSPRSARWVQALGLFGAVTLLLVTLASSRTEPLLHGVFVVSSALLGVVAASVLSVALFPSADWLTRGLSLVLIGSALVTLGQYVSQAFDVDAALWLAGAQKITTLALFAFMGRCLVLVRRRAAE